MCYGSWGRKESVTTERLNRTDEFTSQEEKKRKLSGLPCLPPGDFLTQESNGISYVSCIGRQVLYH